MTHWLELAVTALCVLGLAALFAWAAHASWRRRKSSPLPVGEGSGVRALPRLELWLTLLALPFLLLDRAAPLGLAIIAALWLARLVATGRLTVRTPIDWPLWALLLWLPVPILASGDASLTRPAVYRLLAGIALYYALANWASTRRRLAAGAAALLLSGAGLAAAAPLVATGWQGAKLLGLAATLVDWLTPGKPLFSEYLNANVLAGALVIIWPITAALALAPLGLPRRPEAATRAALGLLLALITVILGLTQSRAMLAALAVTVGVLVALWRPRLAAAGCLLLALGAGLVAANRPRPLLRWLRRSGTTFSLSRRGDIWSRSLAMLHDHPWTGIGLGNFPRVQPLHYPFAIAIQESVTHAHNLYLQVGLDLGLPGLVAYLAVLLSGLALAWQAWRRLRRPDMGWLGALATGLLGSQIALLSFGLLDLGGWANKLAFLPWWTLGLTVALHAQSEAMAQGARARGGLTT